MGERKNFQLFNATVWKPIKRHNFESVPAEGKYFDSILAHDSRNTKAADGHIEVRLRLVTSLEGNRRLLQSLPRLAPTFAVQLTNMTVDTYR